MYSFRSRSACPRPAWIKTAIRGIITANRAVDERLADGDGANPPSLMTAPPLRTLTASNPDRNGGGGGIGLECTAIEIQHRAARAFETILGAVRVPPFRFIVPLPVALPAPSVMPTRPGGHADVSAVHGQRFRSRCFPHSSPRRRRRLTPCRLPRSASNWNRY